MAGSHISNRLTALKVKNLKVPGKYEDGSGLRCVVWPSGSKSWVVRITVGQRRVERGLGGYPDVSLDEARRQAELFRHSANSGIDLRAEQKRWDDGVGYFERETLDAFLQLKAPQRKLIQEVILTFAKVHAAGSDPQRDPAKG